MVSINQKFIQLTQTISSNTDVKVQESVNKSKATRENDNFISSLGSNLSKDELSKEVDNFLKKSGKLESGFDVHMGYEIGGPEHVIEIQSGLEVKKTVFKTQCGGPLVEDTIKKLDLLEKKIKKSIKNSTLIEDAPEIIKQIKEISLQIKSQKQCYLALVKAIKDSAIDEKEKKSLLDKLNAKNESDVLSILDKYVEDRLSKYLPVLEKATDSKLLNIPVSKTDKISPSEGQKISIEKLDIIARKAEFMKKVKDFNQKAKDYKSVVLDSVEYEAKFIKARIIGERGSTKYGGVGDAQIEELKKDYIKGLSAIDATIAHSKQIRGNIDVNAKELALDVQCLVQEGKDLYGDNILKYSPLQEGLKNLQIVDKARLSYLSLQANIVSETDVKKLVTQLFNQKKKEVVKKLNEDVATLEKPLKILREAVRAKYKDNELKAVIDLTLGGGVDAIKNTASGKSTDNIWMIADTLKILDKKIDEQKSLVKQVEESEDIGEAKKLIDKFVSNFSQVAELNKKVIPRAADLIEFSSAVGELHRSAAAIYFGALLSGPGIITQGLTTGVSKAGLNAAIDKAGGQDIDLDKLEKDFNKGFLEGILLGGSMKTGQALGSSLKSLGAVPLISTGSVVLVEGGIGGALVASVNPIMDGKPDLIVLNMKEGFKWGLVLSAVLRTGSGEFKKPLTNPIKQKCYDALELKIGASQKEVEKAVLRIMQVKEPGKPVVLELNKPVELSAKQLQALEAYVKLANSNGWSSTIVEPLKAKPSPTEKLQAYKDKLNANKSTEKMPVKESSTSEIPPKGSQETYCFRNDEIVFNVKEGNKLYLTVGGKELVLTNYGRGMYGIQQSGATDVLLTESSKELVIIDGNNVAGILVTKNGLKIQAVSQKAIRDISNVPIGELYVSGEGVRASVQATKNIKPGSSHDVGSLYDPKTGHVIEGSIYKTGAKGEETFVIAKGNDEVLRKIIDKLIKTIKAGDKSGSLSEEQILEIAFKEFKDMGYMSKTNENALEKVSNKKTEHKLGEIMKDYGTVCRHHAAGIASTLEHLIMFGNVSQGGYLHGGKVFYVAGEGHAWAIYKSPKGKLYVLDAAQNQFFELTSNLKMQYHGTRIEFDGSGKSVEVKSKFNYADQLLPGMID